MKKARRYVAARPLAHSSMRNWFLPLKPMLGRGRGRAREGRKESGLCLSQVVHDRSLLLLGLGQVLPDDRQQVGIVNRFLQKGPGARLKSPLVVCPMVSARDHDDWD
jgi:hypothetical protein